MNVSGLVTSSKHSPGTFTRELLTDFDFEREFHKNKFVFDYLFNFFIYLKKEIELRALQRFILKFFKQKRPHEKIGQVRLRAPSNFR